MLLSFVDLLWVVDGIIHTLGHPLLADAFLVPGVLLGPLAAVGCRERVEQRRRRS